jgi:transposase
MRAYSIDLRERVVAACDVGDATRKQVAARFSVSVVWIRKLLRQRRQTGSIAPQPHGGGQPRVFDAAADDRLRQAVRDHDDATLAELASVSGVTCCPSAVHRALARLGVTRKKSPGGRPSRTGRS